MVDGTQQIIFVSNYQSEYEYLSSDDKTVRKKIRDKFIILQRRV